MKLWLHLLPTVSAAALDVSTLSPLVSWLSSHGGGTSVAVGHGPDGLRGLVACRAAKRGDVLLEVPLACCMSDFGAEGAAITVEPPGCTLGLEWTVQLACSVLALRGDDASPFLDSWPAAPALPIFSPADELPHVCDVALLERVREQRAWADGQYARAREAAHAHGDAVLEAALATPTPFLEARVQCD
jgi:hypothetical protein